MVAASPVIKLAPKVRRKPSWFSFPNRDFVTSQAEDCRNDEPENDADDTSRRKQGGFTTLVY
jgi:hypothetical protein